jgi:ubiquinone/menaquinone biosynthesis C-methylase UbiE
MNDSIPGDTTAALKTERLNEMAFAYKNAASLIAAIELGVFTAIENGAGTDEELAAEIGLEAEKIQRLAIVCRALNLIAVVDGRYQCVSDVSRYLVKGKSAYFGDYLVYQGKQEMPLWTDVVRELKGGDGPPEKNYYLSLMQDETAAREFTEAGYNSSLSLAHRLAKQFDFSRFHKWLDLGGGSGCYSIAACERSPGLKTVIMDLPNVLKVTRDFVAKHGLEDRIGLMEGNFFETDYPRDCDLISFVTPLQSYMPDDVIKALGRASDAVLPGGSVLVVDYMLRDDKSGPLDSAWFNLQGVRNGEYMGRVNSGAEFTSYMESVGLTEVRVEWLMSHQLGWVEGKKPK